ncbi:MAG: flagellar biosynthetic protein FliO [Planctomycetes bacterium]|nr:flagellar biosynthetic protein FliO [Planctomycetota bacterium]
MRKKRNIITIVVVIFILLTAFISLTGEQNIVFAGEDDTSIFLSDTDKDDAPVSVNMYTKIVSSLLVLIAIIIAVVFVLKKNYGFKANIGRGKKHIQVMEHQSLGAKRSLFLVKVPGKHLLLGVTNERVALITEVANGEIDVSGESVNKGDFISLIKKSYLEKKNV